MIRCCGRTAARKTPARAGHSRRPELGDLVEYDAAVGPPASAAGPPAAPVNRPAARRVETPAPEPAELAAILPAHPPGALWRASGELAAHAARSTREIAGDQLAGLDAEVHDAIARLERGEPVNRLPVPRRPWRRVWCWLSLGHYWFPSVSACLDCGKIRIR